MVIVLITQNGFLHVKLKPHICARAKAGREVYGQREIRICFFCLQLKHVDTTGKTPAKTLAPVPEQLPYMRMWKTGFMLKKKYTFLWELIARFTCYFKQRKQKALVSNSIHRVESWDGDLLASAFSQLCPHLLLLVKVTGDFRETLFNELQGYNPRKPCHDQRTVLGI